ncbi:hypothetical protein C2G38_2098185, partial [Gigaspora rosea]
MNKRKLKRLVKKMLTKDYLGFVYVFIVSSFNFHYIKTINIKLKIFKFHCFFLFFPLLTNFVNDKCDRFLRINFLYKF